MPYLTHFNLAEHPFALTPDTGLYFPGLAHQEVYESVRFAMARGEGIVKISGEVGTGKTLLCRMLLGSIGSEMAIAYINNPRNDAEWVVRAVCREFGLDVSAATDLYDCLNRFLIQKHAEGVSTVVLVDEAQALGETGLESIRLLSNLETEKRKLLQIVMFGQPELDLLLQRHDLRQVAQRINFSFELKPLTEAEAIGYTRYRVKMASRNPDSGLEVFAGASLAALARAGKGNPRWMNIIGDKSLIAAYAEGAMQVQPKHVRAAVNEARQLSMHSLYQFPAGWWRKPVSSMLTAAVLLSCVTVLGAAGYIAVNQPSSVAFRPWLMEKISLLGNQDGE